MQIELEERNQKIERGRAQYNQIEMTTFDRKKERESEDLYNADSDLPFSQASGSTNVSVNQEELRASTLDEDPK